MLSVLVLVQVLVASGCTNNAVVAADQLRTLIERDLKPGDPDEKITEFMRRNGWACDFDKFAQGYQCIHRQSRFTNLIGVESAAVAWVDVNGDRSFQRAKVEVLYTYF